MKLSFTLGTGSNGIAPLTEAVRLQLGTFSTTIPAGSCTFKPAQLGKKGKPGKPTQFTFEGVINGVALEAKITDLGNGTFEFKAEGERIGEIKYITLPTALAAHPARQPLRSARRKA